MTAEHVAQMREAGITEVQVTPYLTEEVTYMSADEEDHFTIAQMCIRDRRGAGAAEGRAAGVRLPG